MALLLEIDEPVDGHRNLVLGHVALVGIGVFAGGFDGERRVHDHDGRDIHACRPAVELVVEELMPVVDGAADRLRLDAERIGVEHARDHRRVIGVAAGDFPRVGIGEVHHLVGRDALARDRIAGQLAIPIDRGRLVPVRDLGRFDRLIDAARHGDDPHPELDVGDIDGIGLRGQPVEHAGVIGDGHLNREWQIDRRLLGDLDDRRVRHAGMVDHDVLRILRPDGGEPAESLCAGCDAGDCGGSLEDRAPARSLSPLLRGLRHEFSPPVDGRPVATPCAMCRPPAGP